jgi:hypothetical protein
MALPGPYVDVLGQRQDDRLVFQQPLWISAWDIASTASRSYDATCVPKRF